MTFLLKIITTAALFVVASCSSIDVSKTATDFAGNIDYYRGMKIKIDVTDSAINKEGEFYVISSDAQIKALISTVVSNLGLVESESSDFFLKFTNISARSMGKGGGDCVSTAEAAGSIVAGISSMALKMATLGATDLYAPSYVCYHYEAELYQSHQDGSLSYIKEYESSNGGNSAYLSASESVYYHNYVEKGDIEREGTAMKHSLRGLFSQIYQDYSFD